MENNNMLEKTVDTLSNVTKLAANLSDKKSVIPEHRDDSNNAKTGNQSTYITVDNGKKKEPKPIEKHIHEFPENRALTVEECELALKKAKMDYDIRREDQIFQQKVSNREWEYNLERDKKLEKRRKVRNFLAGLFGVATVGGMCYMCYSDYRHNRVSTPVKPIQNGEGTVE